MTVAGPNEDQATRVSGDASHQQHGTSESVRNHTQEPTVEKTAIIDEEPDMDASPEGVHYLTGTKFWVFMVNLCAVVALSAIDMSIVATAVPRIRDHFHTEANVGWYVIAFRLCQCAFQFLYVKTKRQKSISLIQDPY